MITNFKGYLGTSPSHFHQSFLHISQLEKLPYSEEGILWVVPFTEAGRPKSESSREGQMACYEKRVNLTQPVANLWTLGLITK